MATTALLLIDFINPLTFEGGTALRPAAVAAADRVAALKQRARHAGVPIVYVNDNFGYWHLGFRELVEHFREQALPGAPLIERLAPDLVDDHYVLKPMLSGFYATSLRALLDHLGARRLILTGIAGDICVLFTAGDAHMRRFDVVVPEDAVASERAPDNAHAVRQMERLFHADTRPTARIIAEL